MAQGAKKRAKTSRLRILLPARGKGPGRLSDIDFRRLKRLVASPNRSTAEAAASALRRAQADARISDAALKEALKGRKF